ncbi:hypothetical protein O181_092617 [Austropuccinia psidii MF-1]|uniref:Uncharacterized protein n=1 Tax=Austropuccinia psidii MF-1 TaxID=1389203 RepID=A0A9Q3IZU6_9BASI|nr:hypothetical protein [Austropuccinia psidii MF-1]
MEEPFGKSQLYFFCSFQIFLTFPSTISSLSFSTPSIIIIENMPVRSPHVPPPSTPTPVPSPEIPPIARENPTTSPPAPSFPHSHNEARQEFTDL